MAIHYYYIDDDPESQKKLKVLKNEELSIDAMQHKRFLGVTTRILKRI